MLLCAGSGTRARDVTGDVPKCLLEIDAVSLLARARAQLARAGVRDSVVVAGFEWRQLASAVGPTGTVRVWDGWETANNLWTLGANVDLLEGGGDRVILFGDVVFDPGILDALLDSPADVALAVDGSSRLEGTMRVRLRDGALEIGNRLAPAEADGNFVGILKLSERACAPVAAELARRFAEGRDRDDYYTAVLPDLAHTLSIECVSVGGNRWAEVDTPADYARARSIFETGRGGAGPCAG
ncbi:hypothetical protein AWH51_07760 [Clavibacter tessellarius]|uniref:MobA-like NTP transferase domain-containing protein n=1 Tax=Clavibacter tessellarius TaxID=31965 RepID=A0A154V2E6_9MICO|nr:hypothetical protein AWH51_07760 [Clavibacter michiganensis subsp. tessellarius]